jgi:hypothetical protein
MGAHKNGVISFPSAQLSPKLTCKCCGQARISKTPPDHCAIGGVRAVAAQRLDALLSVKLVHRIEPRN